MAGKPRRPRQKSLAIMEEEQDEMTQVYKNRLMAHDIHRVKELSALLEERRRYFDGQLGEVYRNAGVNSPNSSLPRLRGSDSPPPSDSNMGIFGHNDRLSTGGQTIEIQSARSHSVFADDECSVADSFEYAESKARLGRNWSSSTLLGTTTGNQQTRGGGDKYGERSAIASTKDFIQNEVMRTTDLEKKLKARRSSLPLALEASLKRPLKKKVLTKTNKGSLRKDKSQQPEVNLQTITASLLTKSNGYPDSSEGEDDDDSNKFSSGEKIRSSLDSKKFSSQPTFSMTDTLNRMRKLEVSQDLKRTLGQGKFPSIKFGKEPMTKNNNDMSNLIEADKGMSSNFDYEIVGGAPRISPIYTSNTGSHVQTMLLAKKSTGSTEKSPSSNVAPLLQEYSPRSSLSTVSGSYPKIAFSSLEKMYREEQGDRVKSQLNLWKPVPKIDMNIFSEANDQTEPDYIHDFRYLSLLDALVPCFEPSQQWEPAKVKTNDHFLLQR